MRSRHTLGVPGMQDLWELRWSVLWWTRIGATYSSSWTVGDGCCCSSLTIVSRLAVQAGQLRTSLVERWWRTPALQLNGIGAVAVCITIFPFSNGGVGRAFVCGSQQLVLFCVLPAAACFRAFCLLVDKLGCEGGPCVAAAADPVSLSVPAVELMNVHVDVDVVVDVVGVDVNVIVGGGLMGRLADPLRRVGAAGNSVQRLPRWCWWKQRGGAGTTP